MTISTITGAAVKFNNSFIIPDHGMIVVDDLAIGEELSCIAISQCCSLFPRLSEDARVGLSPSGIGSWLYPNGSYVLPTISDNSYGIVRHHGKVNLHRQGSHTAEGIWRCVVPGSHGSLDMAHIGVYSVGQGTYFGIKILRRIHFCVHTHRHPTGIQTSICVQVLESESTEVCFGL